MERSKIDRKTASNIAVSEATPKFMAPKILGGLISQVDGEMAELGALSSPEAICLGDLEDAITKLVMAYEGHIAYLVDIIAEANEREGRS